MADFARPAAQPVAQFVKREESAQAGSDGRNQPVAGRGLAAEPCDGNPAARIAARSVALAAERLAARVDLAAWPAAEAARRVRAVVAQAVLQPVAAALVVAAAARERRPGVSGRRRAVSQARLPAFFQAPLALAPARAGSWIDLSVYRWPSCRGCQLAAIAQPAAIRPRTKRRRPSAADRAFSFVMSLGGIVIVRKKIASASRINAPQERAERGFGSIAAVRSDMKERSLGDVPDDRCHAARAPSLL